MNTENHLIVAHEVTNVGHDRAQLANMAEQAKTVLQADKLEAVADRGYFDGEEIWFVLSLRYLRTCWLVRRLALWSRCQSR